MDQQPGAAATESRQRLLGVADFTLLVVGAIVVADVYIVAGLGARQLGPAQLVAWLVAGLIAAGIGLAFVQCAAICPEVGGSYAYVRAAFGPFLGFLAGWALYLGEWVALSVFPFAFFTYLGAFVPMRSAAASIAAKLLLVGAVTTINVRGAQSSGRLNDVLTIARLAPLALLVLAALVFVAVRPGMAGGHLTPFAPLGWGGFGPALILIFWAYAGFELSVLPAVAIAMPTIRPHGSVRRGMAIATAFYLLTALAVVVALPWQTAAGTPRPLAEALRAALQGSGLPARWALPLMSLGALIAIVGVFDVFMLSVSRLSYALARDGLFPTPFARLHRRYGTPWAGLLFQAGSALGVSLLSNVGALIAASVFFLGLCYLLTAAAALRLVKRHPDAALRLPYLRAVLVLAGASGVYLASQAPARQIAFGSAALVAGPFAYGVRRWAWRNAAPLEGDLRRGEQRFECWLAQRERWLLNLARRRVHGVADPGAAPGSGRGFPPHA